jgi:polysaccharide biosynthesis transport protein
MFSMSTNGGPSQAINLIDVLRGLWRRKLFILCTLLLGIGAGFALIAVSKPTYQSEARVIVENLATSYEKTNSVPDSRSDPIDDRTVLSQISVIESDDLAARISASLKLTEQPEFNPLLRPIGALKSWAIRLGFSDDPHLMTPEQLAIKNIAAKRVVYQIPQSNVIGIKFQSSDGKGAADIANAIAESYILSTRETAAGSTNRAREWLAQQISDLREKVSASENAVEKYRSEAGLLKGETVTLGTQQISELNSQITLAEAASSEATARVNEIKSVLASKGSVDASSDVLNSSVIQNLREQQVAASRKVSELSAVYLPNHPKMMAAQKELTTVNAQIRREALKVVDSLVGQAKIAAARANSLRNNLETLKGREAGANISDVKLKELERDALVNRTLLETMLSRFADANARQDLSLQPGYARIIQKALVPPSPFFPKPGPLVLLTSLGGLGLGLGLAFMLEVMAAASRMNQPVPTRQRIHPAQSMLEPEVVVPSFVISQDASTSVAAENVASLPEKTMAAIAILPASNSAASALKMITESSAGAATKLNEVANKIAANFLRFRNIHGFKTMSFTSVGSAAPNAALAAIATARVLAERKLKVIVLDVATQNSDFDSLLGIEPGPGLTDLVAREADFTKIICRDPHSSAHAIRFGQNSNPVNLVLVSQKIGSVITALESIYDMVLLHAGEASPATPAMVKDCKTAVFLAPLARQRDTASAARMLEASGVALTMFVQLEPAAENADVKEASA